MQIDNDFYKLFLEELNNLDKFRMSYASTHSTDLLGRDDPDVKRLLEAIAFFSTRTQYSSLRNIHTTQRRLFEQYFSFLLDPLASMGMLQCKMGGNFTDPITLPKESEVLLETDEGAYAMYRTLADLEVFPITLKDVELIMGAQKGFRLLLKFKANFPKNENLKQLNIYISHLNNYHSSLHFVYTLRKHFEKISIMYDKKVSATAEGEECGLDFGSLELPETVTNKTLSHPLQKIRSFFHFPQQELYMKISLPPSPRNWSSFCLCIDVDEDWPKNLNINKDMFQLFTIPMINLKHTMAKPFECDGMKDRYPVYPGNPQEAISLHSVTGVFEITKEGMTPLKPGIIVGGSGSYEVEHAYTKKKKKTWILLNYPEAFLEPKKIAIEGLWYQPEFSEELFKEIFVSLFDRNIIGTSWETLGEVQPHQENPLEKDTKGLLQMLSLQMKSFFDIDDIHCLLGAIGSATESNFKKAIGLIGKLDIDIVPENRQVGGIKHIYKITIADFENSYIPMIEIFFRKLHKLIDICASNVSVVLEVYNSGSKLFIFQ